MLLACVLGLCFAETTASRMQKEDNKPSIVLPWMWRILVGKEAGHSNKKVNKKLVFWTIPQLSEITEDPKKPPHK